MIYENRVDCVIGATAARCFCCVGAIAAFACAAGTFYLFFRGVWSILADTIILLLGGWGMIRGKRFFPTILLIYILASQYELRDYTERGLLEVIRWGFVIAYALGLVGTFASSRCERIKRKVTDLRWIDYGIGKTFTRLAGVTGVAFGIVVWLFSWQETGEFTYFNCFDALLIMVFAWQTLKEKIWAATAQLILSATNMALSYYRIDSLRAILGFIPLLLFEIYCLGFIGAMVCGTVVQSENGMQSKSALG